MDTGMLLTVYLTSALIGGIIAGTVAPVKNRHPGYWLIAAFLFPPIVLLLLLLPKGRFVSRPGRDPFHDEDDRDHLL